MSYQKKRPIRAKLSKTPFTLSQGARGCNAPSTETRSEKLARKTTMRAKFHEAAQDHDRITSLMAGTHWTKERRLANGRILASRKVDRHEYLPHQGEREIARRKEKTS